MTDLSDPERDRPEESPGLVSKEHRAASVARSVQFLPSVSHNIWSALAHQGLGKVSLATSASSFALFLVALVANFVTVGALLFFAIYEIQVPSALETALLILFGLLPYLLPPLSALIALGLSVVAIFKKGENKVIALLAFFLSGCLLICLLIVYGFVVFLGLVLR